MTGLGWYTTCSRRAALCAGVALGLWLLLGAGQEKNAPREPLRVLFVGNSYTAFHRLPELVAALSRAAKPAREIEVESITPGGFTLEQHWNETGERSPRKRIEDGKFDFVVLQEQSQRPLREPEKMLEYARRFGEAITAAGARPVFYMTWARAREPEDQAPIAKAYADAAAAGAGLLAPVGLAWQEHLKSSNKLALHGDDGSHPSPAGSYLAALVIYGAITGDSVETLPSKLSQSDGQGGEIALVELAPRDAKRLRSAATKALAAKR